MKLTVSGFGNMWFCGLTWLTNASFVDLEKNMSYIKPSLKNLKIV